MHNEGVTRYRHQRRVLEEKKRSNNLLPHRILMQDNVGCLARAITNFVGGQRGKPGRNNVATKYLEMVCHKRLALITVQIVIDSTTVPDTPTQTTAYKVAKAAEDEVRLTEFAKAHPEQWRHITRLTESKTVSHKRKVYIGKLNEFQDQWQAWPRKDMYSLGYTLIGILEQVGNLITQRNKPCYKTKKPRQISSITLTDEAQDWIEDCHTHHEASRPLYMPMVEPPRDWVSPTEGGYPDNVMMRWPLIATKRANFHLYDLDKIPAVYSAVNSMQHTGWRVNMKVFAVANKIWDSGGGQGGLPLREKYPLPARAPELDDLPRDHTLVKEWKRRAARAYSAEEKLKGKRTHTGRTLAIARELLYQPFWYPYKMDFRGRVYSVPQFLSPQGNDLSKGLLCFDESKDVRSGAARRWLAIHGANCWGNKVDKLPLDERVAWVDNHREVILDIANAPLGRCSWTSADAPFQFLAFAFEWAGLLKAEEVGKPFASRLPIAMDGTNNGLQLFSLLMRDEVGAKATNVSPADKPEDIYQDVADKVTAKLVRDIKGHEKKGIRETAATWLSLMPDQRIPRKATKRCVMVVPYSGTKFACREYVDEWLGEVLLDQGLLDKPPFKRHESSVYLTDLIWHAIHETVTSAGVAMEWFRECVGVFNRVGLAPTWTVPSGLTIRQETNKLKGEEIKTKVGMQTIYRSLKLPTNELDKRKQSNGIAPNLIHSLDASVLHCTVNSATAQGVSAFAMVHDSYGTHAADAEVMASTLRRVAADHFNQDLLTQIRDGFTSQLEEAQHCASLPPTPEYGNLNPEIVVSSTYFFA